MHIHTNLIAALWPLLVIVGLVVIGSVFGRRAGAGSTRMWWGLGLLMLLQVLSAGWGFMLPTLAYRGQMSIATLSLGYGLVHGILFLLAIGLLVSAVAIGRSPQQIGYLDANRPGQPPTPYQGSGYPPVQGRSPYESGPDGGR